MPKSLATLLKHEESLKLIKKFRRDTQSAIEELERNKHVLISRLGDTLKRIAAQRAELGRLEELAVAEMVKEDGEYEVFTGTNLEQDIEYSETDAIVVSQQEMKSEMNDVDSVEEIYEYRGQGTKGRLRHGHEFRLRENREAVREGQECVGGGGGEVRFRAISWPGFTPINNPGLLLNIGGFELGFALDRELNPHGAVSRFFPSLSEAPAARLCYQWPQAVAVSPVLWASSPQPSPTPAKEDPVSSYNLAGPRNPSHGRTRLLWSRVADRLPLPIPGVVYQACRPIGSPLPMGRS